MNINQIYDPLTRSAIRHGSDKYGGHLYTPIYHNIFGHLQSSRINLLEIGVGGYDSERAGGLSLKMWADYFPYAKITGLDIHKKKLDLPPRVTVLQGSQTDKDILIKLVDRNSPLDIVIDDGSHIVDHMITTFLFLYPQISPTGFYAIEDTQTSFMPAMGGSLDGRSTIFDIAQQVSLAMHTLEGYSTADLSPQILELGKITRSVSIFRNVIIFERGQNTYPSNTRLDLSNEEVQQIFEGITLEAELNPSFGSALSRIDMLIWAHRKRDAEQLALECAERFPTNVSLLNELIRLMNWADANNAKESIIARLDKIRLEFPE